MTSGISSSMQNRWDKAGDVVGRVCLIVVMYFVAEAAVGRLASHVRALDQSGPVVFALDFAQDSAFFCFALMVCVLAALRLPAVGKAAGIPPKVAALLGGFMLGALAIMPRAESIPQSVKVASLVLLLIGNAATATGLCFLGRSFSIMPEARRLVTTGPYRFVRHPLYVGEAVAIAGAFLAVCTWQAALLCVTQTGFQLLRIRYEEDILRRTFPEYSEYARRVPRFIPRLRNRAS
jgi:protein-S-isoprenylcysteine O-methyltransferase Ste14